MFQSFTSYNSCSLQLTVKAKSYQIYQGVRICKPCKLDKNVQFFMKNKQHADFCFGVCLYLGI